MKRTSLNRYTPLRARKPMKKRGKKTKERDANMAKWKRTHPKPDRCPMCGHPFDWRWVEASVEAMAAEMKALLEAEAFLPDYVIEAFPEGVS